MSDKERFPTFARTEAPDSQVVKSLLSLMAHFGWRVFQPIVEASPTERYRKVAEALETAALLAERTPRSILEYKNNQNEPNWFELIQSTRNETRSESCVLLIS